MAKAKKIELSVRKVNGSFQLYDVETGQAIATDNIVVSKNAGSDEFKAHVVLTTSYDG